MAGERFMPTQLPWGGGDGGWGGGGGTNLSSRQFLCIPAQPYLGDLRDPYTAVTYVRLLPVALNKMPFKNKSGIFATTPARFLSFVTNHKT